MTNKISIVDPVLFKPFHKLSNEIFRNYWRKHFTANRQLGLDDQNIKGAACRSLGFLTIGTAGTLFALKAVGIIASLPSCIIPLCILTSIFTFWCASHLEKQTQEITLELLRKETKKLTLQEIVNRHSWKDLFTLGLLTPEEFAYAYRKQMKELSLLEIFNYYEKAVKHLESCNKTKYIYFIPLPNEFYNKWHTETANKTFEQIIQLYPLEKLQKYRLLNNDELHVLQKLNDLYQRAKNQRQVGIKTLDEHAPEDTFHLQELNKTCEEINQDHQYQMAKDRLLMIDSEYYSKCASIRNQFMKEKEKAYAAVDRFLKNHPVPAKWRVWDQFEHDRLFRQYFHIINPLEKSAQVKIDTLDREFIKKHNDLNREIAIGQQQHHQKLKTEADDQTELNCQRLLPIERRFQDIVKDLNHQYDARRRMLHRTL